MHHIKTKPWASCFTTTPKGKNCWLARWGKRDAKRFSRADTREESWVAKQLFMVADAVLGGSQLAFLEGEGTCHPFCQDSRWREGARRRRLRVLWSKQGGKDWD